jgi:hypothetical protein
MRIFTLYTIAIFHLFSLSSCSQNNIKNKKKLNAKSSEYYDDNDFEEEEEEKENNPENKYEDGTHSANVTYYNSETGYSQSYTLDVEVEDGEVKQINFPNGGWLDSDHISPEEIDENGNCNIEGENGKSYEIEIED